MVTVAGEVREIIGLFSEIAQTDIISTGLLVVGSLLVGISILVFGGLSLGAALNEVKYRLFG